MARKRKPKTTNDLKSARVPVDLDGDGKPDIDISMIEDEKPEPVKPSKPVKVGSLDELIASIYKNPQPYRFIAPVITGYKLAVGTRTIEFRKSPTTKVGELITDDPWVIEQLLRNRDYGNKYYAEDARLRNF